MKEKAQEKLAKDLENYKIEKIAYLLNRKTELQERIVSLDKEIDVVDALTTILCNEGCCVTSSSNRY